MPSPSGVAALSNNAPPNDKNNPPPTGLHWGDGELRTPKQKAAASPDVKGVFTDSVIARLPEIQVEEDAVAQLFANDARGPAPSLTPPPPQQQRTAYWHEPGSTMQGHVPPNLGKPKSLASSHTQQRTAAGAFAQQQSAPPAADPRKRAATLLGASAPQGAVNIQAQPRLPAGTVSGPTVDENGIAIPMVRANVRRNSLPAGALREGRKPSRAAEPVVTAAAQAEAAAQQTRTLESDAAVSSGLELDIPGDDRESMRLRQGLGSLPASPANTNSLRTPAAGNSLRPRPVSAVVPQAPAASASSLRVKAGAVAPAADPSSANANSARAKAAAAHAEALANAEDARGVVSSYPPGSAKARRAEARRAARRKAAKHLPPPPVVTRKPMWDPARVTLTSFAGVLLLGALGLGAAEAGWWELPPRAAAMLGIGGAHASLSRTTPETKPHLVMPAATSPHAAAKNTLTSDVVPTPATTAPAAATSETAPGSAATSADKFAVPSPFDPAAANQPKPFEHPNAPISPDAFDFSSELIEPAKPTSNAASTQLQAVDMPEPQPVAAPSPATTMAPPQSTAASATMSAKAAMPQPTAAARVAAALEQVAAQAPPPAQPSAPSAPAAAAPVPTAQPAAATAPAATLPATQAGVLDADDAETASLPTKLQAAKNVAIARNRLKAHDASGAAELMLRQVSTDPEDHHAMEVLIRAWIAMGRGDDALRYAEMIVKKRPRRAAYRVLEGDARTAAGDPSGAQVAWRVALELEPDNKDAKRRLGL